MDLTWKLVLWFSVALLLLMVVLFLRPDDARAQQLYCGERNKIVSELLERYDERPAWVGLNTLGNVVEVLQSPSGSWTIISTLPSGQTCILMFGMAGDVAPTPNEDTST